MLGDRIVVTTTTGPGKTDEVEVRAHSAGGRVHFEFDEHGWIVVYEYGRRLDVRRKVAFRPDAVLYVNDLARRR